MCDGTPFLRLKRTPLQVGSNSGPLPSGAGFESRWRRNSSYIKPDPLQIVLVFFRQLDMIKMLDWLYDVSDSRYNAFATSTSSNKSASAFHLFSLFSPLNLQIMLIEHDK